jgi:serine/threonine protein phosphatase PrpC
MEEGEACGDAARHIAFTTASGNAAQLLAIVDGLGHGADAAKAADAAMRWLAAHPALPLPELMEGLDHELVHTRGAAVGLVRIDGTQARHAGVGNTRVLRWRGEKMARLSSQYGIVGGGLGTRVAVTEIDLEPDDWLLLFTDGLDEMLQLPAHLPEWQRDPALLCDHLLARWRAPRDDAGVLACRLEAC